MEKDIQIEIKNIYEKINDINLKINRVINKFDYLIELLNEVGQNNEEEE